MTASEARRQNGTALMPERHYWDTTAWLAYEAELGGEAGPMSGLMASVERGEVQLLFSAITFAEVLFRPAARPPRPWPDPHPLDGIFDAAGLSLVQIDREVGEIARRFRRTYAIKTPDALHLACAAYYNADFLISRDSDLLRIRRDDVRRRDEVPLKIRRHNELAGGLFEQR